MSDENKQVNLDTQLKDERAFYLGKTDKVPGSDMSLADAKKAHATNVANFEKKNAERAANVNKANLKTQTAFRKENGLDETSTSVVTPGVLVDVKMPESVVGVDAMEHPALKPEPLPSDDELGKLDKGALIALANDRGVDVTIDVDTKAVIIQKLKGEYVPEKESKPEPEPEGEKT